MLALQKTHPGFGLELRDVADPTEPGESEVMVEVEAAGVCGSDLHVYEWTPGFEFMLPALPVTVGHEFAGRIAATGKGVHAPRLGDRVTVMPSVVCGACAACRRGTPEACTDRSGIGLTRPGAFTRLVAVPAHNCVRIPDGVSADLAALTEPFSVGAHAVARGEVRRGDRVLVLGPGTIGQTIAVMARDAGASLVAIAGKDDGPRLHVLRDLGFEHAIDLARESLEDAMTRLIEGAKFDRVFEATGVPASVAAGLRALRHGGVLVTLGIHPEPVAIDVTRLIREQQQIRGSHRASRLTWETVLAFLAAHGGELGPMITHRVPLSRALEGFELARSRQASKVLVVPDESA